MILSVRDSSLNRVFLSDLLEFFRRKFAFSALCVLRVQISVYPKGHWRHFNTHLLKDTLSILLCIFITFERWWAVPPQCLRASFGTLSACTSARVYGCRPKKSSHTASNNGATTDRSKKNLMVGQIPKNKKARLEHHLGEGLQLWRVGGLRGWWCLQKSSSIHLLSTFGCSPMIIAKPTERTRNV